MKDKIKELEAAFKEWREALEVFNRVPESHLFATQCVMAPRIAELEARYLKLHREVFPNG